MSLITKGINVIWNATEKAVKGEWTFKDGIDEIGAAASFVGIPITNITRDVRSILNTFNPVKGDEKDIPTKNATAMKAMQKYQEKYDASYRGGFSEEECTKRAEQAARNVINTDIKPQYLEAINEKNYDRANALRSFIYHTGFYKDKNGKPSLSRVDDLLEDWKENAKEKNIRTKTAIQRFFGQ